MANNIDRLKRPSSLSKALIPSSPSKNPSKSNYSIVSTFDRNKYNRQHAGGQNNGPNHENGGLEEYAQDYQDPIDCTKKQRVYHADVYVPKPSGR